MCNENWVTIFCNLFVVVVRFSNIFFLLFFRFARRASKLFPRHKLNGNKILSDFSVTCIHLICMFWFVSCFSSECVFFFLRVAVIVVVSSLSIIFSRYAKSNVLLYFYQWLCFFLFFVVFTIAYVYERRKKEKKKRFGKLDTFASMKNLSHFAHRKNENFNVWMLCCAVFIMHYIYFLQSQALPWLSISHIVTDAILQTFYLGFNWSI